MKKIFLILSFCLLVSTNFAGELCFEKHQDDFPLKILEGKELATILRALEFAEIQIQKIEDYVILVKRYEDSIGISFLNSSRFHQGEMGVTKGFREVEVVIDGNTNKLLDIKVVE